MADRFWRLRDTGSTHRLAEWNHDEMEVEQVVCPIEPGHRHGGRRLTDLSVILPRGPIQDFVWTWYSECLMQDHILDLFRREGFTGFEARPAKAKLKKGAEKPPMLWELAVTGWGGVVRPESGVKRIHFCEECKHVRYSGVTNAHNLIDESRWDGSDVFLIWPMPGSIFVTERVADYIRDHRLSGAVLKRPDEYESSTAVIDGFSPGRLSYSMPESRARELGERAGVAEI